VCVRGRPRRCAVRLPPPLRVRGEPPSAASHGIRNAHPKKTKGTEAMSVYPLKMRPSSRPARALDGKIVNREHGRFDGARGEWNLTVDQQPAAVVFPESPDDVAAAVAFAREHGLRVAPQGTGHNAGPLGSLEDSILVKTERMRRVHVDPKRWLARV